MQLRARPRVRVGISAAIVVVVLLSIFWGWLGRQRRIEYTGWQMAALAQACAAYMAENGGVMPPSAKELRASSIVSDSSDSWIVVRFEILERFASPQVYPDGIRVDLSNFSIDWSEALSPPSGVLITSRVYPEALQATSLQLTTALRKLYSDLRTSRPEKGSEAVVTKGSNRRAQSKQSEH